MNQHNLILGYIEKHGSITPMQAYEDLGITKLSTRVSEMITRGHKIRKSMEVGINRYGDRTRYMRYFKGGS